MLPRHYAAVEVVGSCGRRCFGVGWGDPPGPRVPGTLSVQPCFLTFVSRSKRCLDRFAMLRSAVFVPRRRLSTNISSNIAQPPTAITATVKRFEALSGKLSLERSTHAEQLVKAVGPFFGWLKANELAPTVVSRMCSAIDTPEQLKRCGTVFERSLDGSELAFQIVQRRAMKDSPCFADLLDSHAIDRSLCKALSSSDKEELHFLQSIGGSPVVRSVEPGAVLDLLRAVGDGPIDAKVVLCDTTILNTASTQRPGGLRVHYIAHGKKRRERCLRRSPIPKPSVASSFPTDRPALHSRCSSLYAAFLRGRVLPESCDVHVRC